MRRGIVCCALIVTALAAAPRAARAEPISWSYNWLIDNSVLETQTGGVALAATLPGTSDQTSLATPVAIVSLFASQGAITPEVLQDTALGFRLQLKNETTGDATELLVRGRHARVRYVREPKPGLDHARNRALTEATGSILAFTDDDVVVDPAWALALTTAFAADPEAMVVTGLVVPYELETDAQLERLKRLEEALQSFPLAAAWEAEGMRLDVARALAGNTRAVVQVGSPEDIARAFILRDIYGTTPGASPNPPAATVDTNVSPGGSS